MSWGVCSLIEIYQNFGRTCYFRITAQRTEFYDCLKVFNHHFVFTAWLPTTFFFCPYNARRTTTSLLCFIHTSSVSHTRNFSARLSHRCHPHFRFSISQRFTETACNPAGNADPTGGLNTCNSLHRPIWRLSLCSLQYPSAIVTSERFTSLMGNLLHIGVWGSDLGQLFDTLTEYFGIFLSPCYNPQYSC
jgi:hypothetical protein